MPNLGKRVCLTWENALTLLFHLYFPIYMHHDICDRGGAVALLIRAAHNNLATSESPYYALASWSQVVDREAFIDRMAAGRTSISKADIVGVAVPRASGKLESPDEPFRPASEDSDRRASPAQPLPNPASRARPRQESFCELTEPASSSTLRTKA